MELDRPPPNLGAAVFVTERFCRAVTRIKSAGVFEDTWRSGG